MTCYSDHNEDIRTKGSCDYCGEPSPTAHDWECTGCEHDCPWTGRPLGAPWCAICDDHWEAGGDEDTTDAS